MNKPLDLLYNESIELLQSLVRTPSFSREESATAEILIEFFQAHDIPTERIGNNVIVRHQAFDPSKPTLLLNSHHDTVKPNAGYTRDPFSADREDGKLYGLGSNDAGGCLVSLIAAFLHYYSQSDLYHKLIFNLVVLILSLPMLSVTVLL